MQNQNLKLLIIFGSATTLFLVIVLPIEQYFMSHSDNFLVSILSEALIYWALLLIFSALLVSIRIDSKGDFSTTLDLSDLVSGLVFVCLIAYGVGLIFSASFKISTMENLKNYEGSPVVLTEKNWLYINGSIGNLTLDTLNQITRINNIQVLELNSGGGLIATALDIASFVEKNKITTFVKGECASACVLIAISGEKLIVSPSAKFGFHNAASVAQPRSQRGQYTSMVASEAMFAFLKKGGIPNNIIKKAEATPANEMYYVTGADLISQGLAIQIR